MPKCDKKEWKETADAVRRTEIQKTSSVDCPKDFAGSFGRCCDGCSYNNANKTCAGDCKNKYALAENQSMGTCACQTLPKLEFHIQFLQKRTEQVECETLHPRSARFRKNGHITEFLHLKTSQVAHCARHWTQAIESA